LTNGKQRGQAIKKKKTHTKKGAKQNPEGGAPLFKLLFYFLTLKKIRGMKTMETLNKHPEGKAQERLNLICKVKRMGSTCSDSCQLGEEVWSTSRKRQQADPRYGRWQLQLLCYKLRPTPKDQAFWPCPVHC
jgi:hypothetical protein